MFHYSSFELNSLRGITMDILEITENLVEKIKSLFGGVNYHIEKGFCRYEGIYRKIDFYHPVKETKISVIVYNKENICIFTTEYGIQCFHGRSIEKTESILNQLSQ